MNTIRSISSTNFGKVLKNAGWSSASTPVQLVLGVIQTAMLVRMLGPQGIGTLTIFGAVTALMSSFLCLTSSEPVIVYGSQAKEQGDHGRLDYLVRYFIYMDFLTSFLAFGAVVIAAVFIPGLFGLPPEAAWLQVLYGLTLIFTSAYWTCYAVLRFCDRFDWNFYQATARSILKTGLVAVLFIMGADLVAVVLLNVFLALIDGLSMYLMARMALKQQGYDKSKLDWQWWRVPVEVRRFQVLGHGRQAIKSLSRYVDTLTIGLVGSPTEVGYYRGGKQLTDIVQNSGVALVNSLFPEYSRLYFLGEYRQLRRLVGQSLALALAVAAGGAIFVWFAAGWIVRIVLGPEFMPAVDIVRVLMISAVIVLVMTPVYSLPAAVGRAGPALWATVAAIAVQAAAIYWLVPTIGAIGAAWSNVIYFVVWMVFMLPSVLDVLRDTGAAPARPAADTEFQSTQP